MLLFEFAAPGGVIPVQYNDLANALHLVAIQPITVFAYGVTPDGPPFPQK